MTGEQFTAATGHSPADLTDTRRAQVRSAYEGLLQIRRLMNSVPAPETVPAHWERRRLVHAVALVLEAAGIVPCGSGDDGRPATPGYRVEATHSGVVVRWVGPTGSGARYEQGEQLRCCERVLRQAGWVAMPVRGPGGQRWLEVEAPRVVG